MRRARRFTAAALLAGVAAVFISGMAEGRSQVELGWSARDVFPVALRFVRVDRNCKVTDKDETAGYIVFECPPDDPGSKNAATRHGALELIAAEGGRAGVRVQLTLSNEPRYIELRFLELLERKVKEERGP